MNSQLCGQLSTQLVTWNYHYVFCKWMAEFLSCNNYNMCSCKITKSIQ